MMKMKYKYNSQKEMVFLPLALTTSMPTLENIGKFNYFPLQCPVPALKGIFSDIKISAIRIGSMK